MDKMKNALPFGKSKVPIRTLFSYVFDYGIIIVLAIIYAALDKFIQPFQQRFSLTDITIQYPYATKERIPIRDAIIISAAFPLVVIATYTLVIDGVFSHRKIPGQKRYTFHDRLWEFNCGVLGLFLAQGAAFCITGTLKNLIGRPRPDLIDRCQPREGSADNPVYGLSNSTICTQTVAAIMQDGFRSFPSGHSSSSFAGLGYLSLYLGGKLHVLDQRGEVWRTVIVIIPTVAASCIAASRIMDYRHHAFDVLFGSVLGLLCGWGAYRQYFPSLGQPWLKGRAYPMRTWGGPVRQPGDRYDGYRTAKADHTTNVLADHGDADEIDYQTNTIRGRQTDREAYGMEPMRSGAAYGHRSPEFEHVVITPPGADDTDYEHVRPKGAVPSALQSPSRGGSNAFREQVRANEALRENQEDDEDDLGYRRPLTQGQRV